MFTVVAVPSQGTALSLTAISADNRPSRCSPWARRQRHSTPTPPPPAARPFLYTLVDRLQGSIFPGGFGSLSRDMEAMDRYLALHPSQSTPQCQQHRTQRSASDRYRPSSSNRPSCWPPTAQAVQQHRENEKEDAFSWLNWLTSEGSTVPLKHYRITIQEIPGPEHDNDLSNRQVAPQTDETLFISTTASVPPSVMNWMLRTVGGQHKQDNGQDHEQAFCQGRDQEKKRPGRDSATCPRPHKEKNESKAFSTSRDSLKSDKDPQFEPKMSSSSSSPSDERNKDLQEQEAKAAHELEAAIAVSLANLVSSYRADDDTFSTTTTDPTPITDPPTMATTTGSGLESDMVFGRSWSPRHEGSIQGTESFRKTTLTRPDGTVETKTVSLNQETGIKETWVRIYLPDGTLQESRSSEMVEPRLRAVAVGQGPEGNNSSKKEEADKRQVPQEQRQIARFRDRLAQRHRERQERRQELREAEARQREATAAAYGFRREEEQTEDEGEAQAGRWKARMQARETHAETSWPPKGYRRRMEREGEGRHE